MRELSLKELYIRWKEEIDAERLYDSSSLWEWDEPKAEPELDENGNSPGFTYGFF